MFDKQNYLLNILLLSFGRASTVGQTEKNWGQVFTLLLPQAAVQCRSDGGIDGVEYHRGGQPI